MWVLIFSTTFICNISHSKKNPERYYLKSTQVHRSSCKGPDFSSTLKKKLGFSRQICKYAYIGFKTFFCVVRHLDSIASYLPTGLRLGFFRSWPFLFLPSSFSSVFLMLSFVSASTSMLFWAIFFLPFFEHCLPCELVLFNLFYNCFL